MVEQRGYVKWIMGLVTVLMIAVLAADVIPGHARSGFAVLTGAVAVLVMMTILVEVGG